MKKALPVVLLLAILAGVVAILQRQRATNETIDNAFGSVSKAASNLSDKAKDTASQVASKAKDVAGKSGNGTADAIADATDSISEAAEGVVAS
jgi:cytoskeletal protein RodZ